MNPILTIRRSAHEIGGNCIEIEYDRHRLFLDAGSPLEPDEHGDPNPIPVSLDLSRPVDGVVVSHPHQDHYGLLRALPESWPVYCGAPTEVLMGLTLGIRGEALAQEVRTFESFRSFRVGPFEVTPYLTDHSAFDAHMLLVEVGGKRILYSGDFRRSGRKAALVDRMLASPPRDVDILLLEGTTLGRDEPFPTEPELEERFVGVFRETPGRVFVTWSAQNIDRTVTLYRACKKAGRDLILDLNSLDVLRRLEPFGNRLPKLGLQNLWGVATGRMIWLYESPDRLDDPEFFTRCRESGKVFGAAKLESGRHPNVIMLRPSLFHDFQKKGVVPTARDAWLFSMWFGYLERDEYRPIRTSFEQAGARLEQIHTSGHASRTELEAFCAAIGAHEMIPIHGFDWDRQQGTFDGLLRLADGEHHEIRADCC